MLGRYGIPLVPGRLVQKVEEALVAAREFGYPVVLKIISPQWLHKSDLGGVRLNLGSEAKVSLAFQEMLAQFARQTPQGELQGVLVQKQVQGTELLFGIKKDPQFGPVLVAGMGGIYTEIFQDVARAFAPVNREEAAAMLQSLRIYPLLRGVRGQAVVALPLPRGRHPLPVQAFPGLPGNRGDGPQPRGGGRERVLLRGLPGGQRKEVIFGKI